MFPVLSREIQEHAGISSKILLLYGFVEPGTLKMQDWKVENAQTPKTYRRIKL